MIWYYGYRHLRCNIEVFHFHCIVVFEFTKVEPLFKYLFVKTQ